MEKVAKVMIGETVVEEYFFDAEVPNESIDAEVYHFIRSNTTIHRNPHTVDIYVFGTEYMIDSEKYAYMSDESIRIAVATTLVNFVEISNV